jgi:hypothetical protein
MNKTTRSLKWNDFPASRARLFFIRDEPAKSPSVMPGKESSPSSTRRFARGLFRFTVVLMAAVSARALEPAYEQTLEKLCDALLATQIVDRTAADFGALVCPSTNPQDHPLHSRAGEAAYPFAVAYRNTHDTRYRDAAIHLARWLISVQQPSGAWGENSPRHDGWTGTTSDQLISLVGAFSLLNDELTPADRSAWKTSIRRAADFIVNTFPVSNINYQPTGAVALVMAAQSLEMPPPAWEAKAAALIDQTLAAINDDGLLVGEGGGVDAGYNLAQSAGYLALYGILKTDSGALDGAAALLRAHLPFVYPNGSIDNSWGTRSYKWTYESGTKTAPGVFFSFALLADRDPRFGPVGRLCLNYLETRAIDHGLVMAGPHATRHASLDPPCLYSTFARAQSLALALMYAPPEAKPIVSAPPPALATDWVRLFPSINVAVVRTQKIMATISGYGAIGRYGREAVSRGGSLTNLWMDGYGADGFTQTSSVTVYRREEKIHMPDEPALLPLTPRIEATLDGVYFSNLFETDAILETATFPGHCEIRARGKLRAAGGRTADIEYKIVYRVFTDRLEKEYSVRSGSRARLRIVEPFVRADGLIVRKVSESTARLRLPNGAWLFSVKDAPVGSTLGCGENAAAYWCPFPAVECYPLTVDFDAPSGKQAVVVVIEFAPAVQPAPAATASPPATPPSKEG